MQQHYTPEKPLASAQQPSGVDGNARTTAASAKPVVDAPVSATFRFSVTPRFLAVTDLVQVSFSLDELREQLGTHEVGEKDGDALIPATFRPCPEKCRNHGKRKALDCGGSQFHRLDANVAAVTMLGADLDNQSPEAFARVLDQLRGLGIAFFWWDTYSSTPDNRCARILIPFAKPLPLANPSLWSRMFWGALIKHVGLPESADPACKNAARIYYLPRKPKDAPEGHHQAGFVEGKLLDWEPVLPDISKIVPVAEHTTIQRAPEDPSRPVDLENVRDRLKRVEKPGTKELIKKLLAGEALSPPPHKRPAKGLPRYQAWLKVTSVFGKQAEEWESTEALLELLKPSHAAEVLESPDDHTDWNKIVNLFVSARDQAPEWRRQDEEKRELFYKGALKAAINTKIPTPIETKPITENQTGEWTDKLITTQNSKGEQHIKNCGANAAVILTDAPQWKGQIKYNQVTKKIDLANRQLTDSDPVAIMNWLAQSEWNLMLNSYQVSEQLNKVARDNTYNPLQEYLKTRTGSIALENVLTAFFNAKTEDEEGHDITEYVKAISEKWFISAVARAMDPGCKVDTVLILEGGQSQNKSQSLEILGGPWFSDDPVDLRNKDTLMLCGSFWILELGELDAMRKSEVSSLKAFFSRRKDNFRSPYGRVIESTPRQCVFVGSTNESEYLQDRTGNRRFWPVRCGQIDLDKLRSARDLIWAEAYKRYKAGVRWWFNREDPEYELIENQTRKRVGNDPIAEVLLAWWRGMDPQRRPQKIPMATCMDVLNRKNVQRYNYTNIGYAMRDLGFTRLEENIPGLRGNKSRYYIPSPALLNMKQEGESGAIERIYNARPTKATA
jgi:predicted P-loop ATPase